MSQRALTCATLALLLLASRGAFCAGRSVYGWVERGLLMPDATPVSMKLDSGARSSSVDGHILAHFQRRTHPWIRFEVRVMDRARSEARSLVFERRIRRKIAVRGAGGMDHRPVVQMRICVGSQVLNEEFSLADRSRMLYPVLLGRRAIAHLGLLDVSRKFLSNPDCPVTQAHTARLTAR